MTVRTTIEQSGLPAILATAKDAVRNDAANATTRLDLAVALMVSGAWDSATNQLKIAADLDSKYALNVALYRKLIEAEQVREAVLSGLQQPVCMGEPAAWLALMVEALKMGPQSLAAAAELRQQALEAAPTSKGSLDGTDFDWIADADPRLGPVAELFVDGRYLWSPFTRILSIETQAPADLIDLIWRPVSVTWSNGGAVRAFMPSRYPVNADRVTDDHKLARRTDFIDLDPDNFIVSGQKMLCTDVGEHPILDMRQLKLETLTVDI
jgi:type VI secretion system protein ImpE